MNITLIVVLLIILLMIIRGYRKGVTKEIVGLISMAVTLFVISLIIMLYTSFRAEDAKSTLFTIIILVMVATVYSIVKIFLKSAKILSKLPVIKIIDRLFGILVGAAEGLIIVWLLYVLNEAGIFGSLTAVIMRDTMNSDILMKLCEYNYLLRMIDVL